MFFDHSSKFAVFSSYFTKFAVFYDLLKKFAVISSPFDEMRDCFAIFLWNLWLFCNSSTCECFADLFVKFSFILLFFYNFCDFLSIFDKIGVYLAFYWQNLSSFRVLSAKFLIVSRLLLAVFCDFLKNFFVHFAIFWRNMRFSRCFVKICIYLAIF